MRKNNRKSVISRQSHLSFTCMIALAALAVYGCDENKIVKNNAELCKSIDCSGHGTCAISTGMQPVCICDNGFHVTTEDLTACVENGESGNDCESVTCSEHGTCAIKGDGKAICICDSGYHVKTSDLKNCEKDETTESACKDITCSGHGTCAVKDDNNAVCICDKNYHLDSNSLTTCVETTNEDDPCEDINCDSHGTCRVSTDENAVCDCDDGYHITTDNPTVCTADGEESPCENVTCSEHGICAINSDEEAVCICDKGYHQEYTTECVEDEPEPEACKNVYCGSDEEGYALGDCAVTADDVAICVCNDGYHVNTDNLTLCVKDTQVISSCANVNCGEDINGDALGVCAVKEDGDPICICNEGYQVKTNALTLCVAIDVAENPCDNVECKDAEDTVQGICAVTAENEAVCICNEGYHFDDNDSCVMDADPCEDHELCGGTESALGTCEVKNGKTAICSCNEGYHINMSDLTTCIADAVDNPCDSIACKDAEDAVKGVCAVTTENEAVCICNAGYHFDNGNCLEDADPCEDHELCGGSESAFGTCEVKNGKTAICSCNEGYHLDMSDLTTCIADAVVVNPCDSVDCKDEEGAVQGVCAVTTENDAVCICNTDHHFDSGKCLKDGNPCEGHELCGGSESALGECHVKNSKTAICACIDGYHITIDDLTTCIENDTIVNPCEDAAVDCGTGGYCAVKSIDNSAFCVCGEGWHNVDGHPEKCEENGPCYGIECDGHGSCTEYGDYPLCVCDSGYNSNYPTNCNEPFVHEDFCDADSYLYYGESCREHGACLNTVEKYACVCDAGYGVDFMDYSKCLTTDENPCDGIDCGGHGACVDYNGLPLCYCAYGYKRDSSDPTKCILDDDFDPCKDVTCSGYGTCTFVESGTLKCDCNDGYMNAPMKPLECIIDECHGINCGGFGTCKLEDMTPVCTCNKGYNNTVDPMICVSNCEGEECGGFGSCSIDSTGSTVCTCNTGYNNTANPMVCESNCKGVECGGFGSCSTNSTGAAVCTCNTGYNNNADPVVCVSNCEGVTCGGYGSCSTDSTGAAVCTCNTGYNNNADPMVCESNCKGVECGGFGSCSTDSTGAAVCTCNLGYNNNADPMVCVNNCEGENCWGFGTCVTDEVTGEAYCNCYNGYNNNEEPLKCESNCKDIDCGEHGKCAYDTTNNYAAVCSCNKGYHVSSTDPFLCVSKCTDPDVTCGGHGTCSLDSKGNPLCTCESGYISEPTQTDCMEAKDENNNHMIDYYETATDQGTDCSDMAKRSSCKSFCDSFIDYKCSTKCTKDTQCMDGFVCRSDGRCAAEAFVTTWQFIGTEEKTLYFYGGGKKTGCNYTIDWGDGTDPETYTTCQNFITHTYAAFSGSERDRHYNISVTGTLKAWECGSRTDEDDHKIYNCDNNDYYLADILSFGDIELGTGTFESATKLTVLHSVDIPNSKKLTSTSFMFAAATKFNSPVEHWDTSNVTNMSYMFHGTVQFNQPLNKWDTSKVKSIGGMFESATAFNQDLDKWDTSSLTNMTDAFFNATSFNGLIFQNTSNVTLMKEAFAFAEKFNQPLNTWDTTNVTTMEGMFNGAKAFNGDITNWNTANVTTMESMFEGASAFNQALTSWDVTKVVASEEYAKMFYGSGLSSTSTNWTSMKQSQPNGWGAMSETILWWLY